MALLNMRLSIVGVAVCALLLPLAASGDIGSNLFFKHFLKQFQDGWRDADDDDSLGSLQPFAESLGSLGSLQPFAESLGSPGSLQPFAESLGSLGSLQPFAESLGAGWEAPQRWWSGPNVCVEREESDDGKDADVDGPLSSFRFTTCHQTPAAYSCTTKIRSGGVQKTVVVRHHCCHGFDMVPGKRGCVEVQLKPLMETLRDVGASEFADAAIAAGLPRRLTQRNLTLFAPDDGALRHFYDAAQAANRVELYIPPARSRRSLPEWEDISSLQELVLGHAVAGFHDIANVLDEQVLYSENDNSSIRLKAFPGCAMTANCQPLSSADHRARDGVVHVLRSVLRPVRHSLMQLVTDDARLAIFKDLLERTGQIRMLEEPGPLTLFAPTDTAFEKLQPAVRDRLLSSRPDSCVKDIVGHHMLKHTLCSCAVMQQASTFSSAGTSLQLERSEDGKLFVGPEVEVIVRDIIATNGVLHIIERVLLPDSGLPLMNVLERQNLTQFARLLKESGLSDEFNFLGNLTIFAPSNEALAHPYATRVIEAAREDPKTLRELVLFHTAKAELQSCDLSNNKEVPSGVDGQNLRINLYTTVPLFTQLGKRATVQCARISDPDRRACGALIHQVDHLLVPPVGDAQHLLAANGNFSMFLRLLNESGLSKELRENSPFTLLAPADEAFARLPEPQMDALETDRELLMQVLRGHILPEVLCCSGVSNTAWPFLSWAESLAGRLHLRHDYEGHIHVGSATITHCDSVTTDGVVHFVDRVMVPDDQKYRRVVAHGSSNPDVEVFLYGL